MSEINQMQDTLLIVLTPGDPESEKKSDGDLADLTDSLDG